MSQVIKVIGIAGQRQNGKDTLADYLATRLVRSDEDCPCDRQKEYPTCWGRGSFAGAVKRIYCETFNKTLEFVEQWKEVPTPPPGMDMPVRQALQFIGDGFRQIQGNIWIELAFRSPLDWKERVFSDLRYLNEARKIKLQGGFNFLVFRPGKINFDKNLSEAEIRPYVEWCEATGREGFIQEWPEFQAAVQDGGGEWYSDRSEFFDNMRLFDYFVRNEDNVDRLLYKIDDVIIPKIKDRYELK